MITRHICLLITIILVVEATDSHRHLRTHTHHTISQRQQQQHGILQQQFETPATVATTQAPVVVTTTTQAPITTTATAAPIIIVQRASNDNGGSQQAAAPQVVVQPATNGFLGLSERQFTILIICGCVGALIFIMLFFFRDKVRVIFGYIETGCYNFFKLILLPFVFLRWLFRRITYPLKQGCWTCYQACYGYCHPASVKV